MHHLDPKAFFIFYFRAFRFMLVSLLISIPVGLIIFIPTYIISTYIGMGEFVLRIIQTCMICMVAYFSLFPFLWGYLAYFRYRVTVDKGGIYFARGVLIHKKTVMPYNHIQSITLLKDHMMDVLGLCSVQIDLIARSQKRPLIISGLDVFQAQHIRNTYLENTKTPEQIL